MNIQEARQKFADKFRQPKKLSREQQDRQEQAKNFIGEYTELCKKHKLQWDIGYEFNHREGLTARFVLIEHREPETKDWEECKKENEKIKEAEGTVKADISNQPPNPNPNAKGS